MSLAKTNPESPANGVTFEEMTAAVNTLLRGVGEDPNREGLLKTPERVARALLFFTSGYRQTLENVVNGAVFEENHNEMVVVRDIDFHSLCEHHMVTFLGKIHIGYVPNNKVLGISKLARIADIYARRLQVQERLTAQIAQGIFEAIAPQGVGVVIEGTHMCMVGRGVQKVGSKTITSSMLGIFQSDPRTRAEFLSLLSK